MPRLSIQRIMIRGAEISYRHGYPSESSSGKTSNSSSAPRDAALPPIILIHGAASASNIWLNQIQPLAQHTHVYAIDLPGHGNSQNIPSVPTKSSSVPTNSAPSNSPSVPTKSSSVPTLTLAQHLENSANFKSSSQKPSSSVPTNSAPSNSPSNSPSVPTKSSSVPTGSELICFYGSIISEFIQALHLPPCILVGHSMGGGVAMQATLQNPNLIAGLILASTAPRMPVSQKLFDLIRNDFQSLGSFLAQYAFSPSTPKTIAEKWTSQPIPTTREIAYADFKSCHELDLTPHLPKLAETKNPATITIIHGTEDVMVAQKDVENLARHLTNGKIHRIEKAGHMVFQESPEKTNALVLGLTQE